MSFFKNIIFVRSILSFLRIMQRRQPSLAELLPSIYPPASQKGHPQKNIESKEMQKEQQILAQLYQGSFDKWCQSREAAQIMYQYSVTITHPDKMLIIIYSPKQVIENTHKLVFHNSMLSQFDVVLKVMAENKVKDFEINFTSL